MRSKLPAKICNCKLQKKPSVPCCHLTNTNERFRILLNYFGSCYLFINSGDCTARDGCAVRLREELCSVRCIIVAFPSHRAAVSARDVINDVITAGHRAFFARQLLGGELTLLSFAVHLSFSFTHTFVSAAVFPPALA